MIESREDRALIHRSWARSECYGIHPHKRIEDVLDPHGLLIARDKAQGFLRDIIPETEKLASWIQSQGSTVIVANMDGYILSSLGDPAFLENAQRVFLKEGAGWSEHSRGTNAIGIAINEKLPVVVLGDEHYCASNHILFCAASPIFDMKGELLGVLDVSGYRDAYHPSILHVVDAMARQFEDWLVVKCKDSQIIVEMRQQSGRKIRALVALDRDGAIIGSNRDGCSLLGCHADQYLWHQVDFQKILSSCLHDSFHGKHDVLRFPSGGMDGEEQEWVVSILMDKRGQKIATPNHLGKENKELRTQNVSPGVNDEEEGIFCRDTRLRSAMDLAKRAAATDLTVLITGGSGTGKELVANYIHRLSKRHRDPFVAVNCGALAPSLFYSEMFGYETGAFTGALKAGKLGKFETAQNGTLFLDEIADMPGDMQTALLRTLQEKSVTRVGGNHPVAVNVRIIAATNKDLWREVSEGRFRADLYFRLFGIQIVLPMLRDREDKFELCNYILKQISKELGLGSIVLSGPAREVISTYPWPGNVREMTAVLRQAAFLAGDGTIKPEHFPLYMKETPSVPMCVSGEAESAQIESPSAKLDKLKDQAILNALKETQGNVSEAARLLGVGRNTVYRRLKKMG